MKFEKPALPIANQILLLRQRGLEIPDEKEAAHYLEFIGYYRLSGYALPLLSKELREKHIFRFGVTFTQILDLYRFDRELRLLVMDAVERVEVAFRSVVSNHLANRFGPHWYLNEKCGCFEETSHFEEFRTKIATELGLTTTGTRERGGDVFIEHYFAKYTSPSLPPTWMVAEILSISTWSKCFNKLRREFQKPIAARFGVAPEVLSSWVHSLCYVRNLCAHHARLWNREFTIRPRIARAYSSELSENSRFYAQAVVLKHLLTKVSPETHWWAKLDELISRHPCIDRAAMGFPKR